MRQYGYHCTEINPEIILKDGFKSGKGGFTQENLLKDFYDKYLPKNPMFLSDLTAEVWSKYSRYCMKIDITGLELFPDFGHLLDYYAYYDEDCFYWRKNNLNQLKISAKKDPFSKKVLNFVENLEDYTLWVKDFTGQMSKKILGTFVIDGNMLTEKRVVEIREAA